MEGLLIQSFWSQTQKGKLSRVTSLTSDPGSQPPDPMFLSTIAAFPNLPNSKEFGGGVKIHILSPLS